MTPWSHPIYPKDRFDIIDAWCWSIMHQRYKELNALADRTLTEKINTIEKHPDHDKVNEMLAKEPKPDKLK